MGLDIDWLISNNNFSSGCMTLAILGSFIPIFQGLGLFQAAATNAGLKKKKTPIGDCQTLLESPNPIQHVVGQ